MKFDLQNNLNKECIKLRKHINAQVSKQNFNQAIAGLTVCSLMQYAYNQSFLDDELEDQVSLIEKGLIRDVVDLSPDSKCVIFYDGFGTNTRGLALIYIRALANIPGLKVIYIRDNHGIFSGTIPDIEKVVLSVGEVIELKEDKYSNKVFELINIINKYKPKNMFFYTRPYDAVAAIVFKHYEGIIDRHQINLSDHTFWLGARSFDHCLEFRNYGASISNKYRKINREKLLLIPFYPVINEKQQFRGYPFPFDATKQRIVFSGGSLYKTLGAGNRYYEVVRHILDTYPDVVFWYAGNGDRTEMNKLIAEYPDRVFLTAERSDLFQVLKHCYFYLSTYPMCGGLMFQYAARAGKLPLTLRHSDVSDEFLIDQENLDIIFDDIDKLYKKIDRIMLDSDYLRKCEALVSKSVITEENFNKQIFNLLESNTTDYEVKVRDIDVESLRAPYLETQTKKDYYCLLAKRGTFSFAIRTYPIKYFKGCFYKLVDKLKMKLKK